MEPRHCSPAPAAPLTAEASNNPPSPAMSLVSGATGAGDESRLTLTATVRDHWQPATRYTSGRYVATCHLVGPGIDAKATQDKDGDIHLRGTWPAELTCALEYVAAVEHEAHRDGWACTACPDGAWAWRVGPRGQYEAVTERAAQMEAA
jgi:hypothetical protein